MGFDENNCNTGDYLAGSDKNNCDADDYLAGLDIGPGTIGHAETDMNYNLLRVNGKTCWGSCTFPSADTAKERRINRGSRRRLNRRNTRIKAVQKIFNNEISKIDPGFFQRLNESRYTPEDKKDINGNVPSKAYCLFADQAYTDRTYHNQFPTVYHLLDYLRTTSETPDIRLVYLGIANMMKHRGHNLVKGDMKEATKFSPIFLNAINTIQAEELGFETLTCTSELLDKVQAILTEKKKKKKGENSWKTEPTKEKKLITVLGASTPSEKAVVKLIVGNAGSLADLFQDNSLSDLNPIKLSDDTLEETLSDVLGEQYHIIEVLKAVYDWTILSSILSVYSCISEAKKALYDKHKSDLKNLKYIVKKYLPDKYEEVFQSSSTGVKKSEALNNYAAYVGIVRYKGEKQYIAKTSKADFYKYIEALIKDITAGNANDQQIIDNIKDDITAETFMPKQRTSANSIIPYQLYLYELDGIIANLQNRVPILKRHGEEIRNIFISRIPYYIGPLNGVNKNNQRSNWLELKPEAEGPLYPWNILDKVDEDKTASNFITRMVGHCTYLPREDVLPKYSLLYSKFSVLNELNPLKIDGKLLSPEEKQHIYNDLFKKHRNVTSAKLHAYLVENGLASKKSVITGIDGNFKSSLVAYHDFKSKFPDLPLSEDDIDEIIYDITLFGGNTHLIIDQLHQRFPFISDEDCKTISRLGYKGWGNLSKRLLVDIKASKADEPADTNTMSIIDRMWQTNDTLMQILSCKYRYGKIVSQEFEQQTAKTVKELLNSLSLSPATKRPIYQVIKIMTEMRKAHGRDPKRIFIEMARDNQASNVTISRREQLTKLYMKLKNSKEYKPIFASGEIDEMLQELGKTSDVELRKDHIFLYFLQLGHCLYTGEKIQNRNNRLKWDIDHLYPQSKIFDDSLDNKILVNRTKNIDKDNVVPIAASIRNDMADIWAKMFKFKLISQEKYNRLIRSTALTDDEKASFINRQLVETRQSTKVIATILKAMFPNTDIVYVKAGLVTKFRGEFGFTKIRELNDLHHAKDAYLNIVVGNTYFTKFTNNPFQFIQEQKRRKKDYSVKVKAIFKGPYDVKRGDEIAWEHGENGTIATVKAMMARNDVLLTHRPFNVTGAFYKVQPLKKGKGQKPLKTADPRLANINKYGGYDKTAGSYAVVVKHVKKKKVVKTIEMIPVLMKEKLKTTTDIESYLSSIGFQNPQVLLKLPMWSLLEFNGYRCLLTGRSNNTLVVHNAVPLIISESDEKLVKKILLVTQLINANNAKKKSNKKENVDIQIAQELKIENSELEALYDLFYKKISEGKWSVLHSATIEKLKNGREEFDRLSLDDKCIVLVSILQLFQTPCKIASLKLLKQKDAQIKKILNEIKDNIPFYVIYQSATGLRETKVDLTKL